MIQFLLFLLLLGQVSHAEPSIDNQRSQIPAGSTFTLSQIYNGNIMNATSIELVDGRNGKRVTITDKTDIDRILTDIKDIELSPNAVDGYGYIHRLIVYQEHEMKLDLNNHHVNDLRFHSNDKLNEVVAKLFEKRYGM